MGSLYVKFKAGMNGRIEMVLSLLQCYLIQHYFKQCQSCFVSAFDFFQPSSLCVCILIEFE